MRKMLGKFHLLRMHWLFLTVLLPFTLAIAAASTSTSYQDSGSIIDWSSIPTPPRFIHEPNPRISYFIVDISPQNSKGEVYRKPRNFRCTAIGIPPPTYSWVKDGKPFPLEMYKDRIIQNRLDGSITFTRFEVQDQGVYECLASNGNGTAVSEKIRIEQAWQHHFPTDGETEIISIELGEAYSRNCTAPDSNPPSHPFWFLLPNVPTGAPQEMQFLISPRISSNERGTIFFHYVNESDFKEHQLYTCGTYNEELKEYKHSSNQFNFNITKMRRRDLSVDRPISAKEQYINQSSPIALMGTIHKLHCFLSGYPVPTPTWYHNGVQITSEVASAKGFSFENHGKTLAFNVSESKMGRYDCKFQGIGDYVDRHFNIKIDAAPYWHDNPPASVNTSEGETVVFDCKVKGMPAPIVTYYKNGVEMKKPKPGSGEKWVVDGSKLTIYDVKKGVNGNGDNAVYQCKAENKHGYLWTNFYLNLLAFQPKLLEEPKVYEAIEGKPFSLQCKFFASPMANVSWESPLLTGAEYYAKVDQFGTGWLMFEKILLDHEGEYTCTGTNKYGSASGTTKLLVRKPTSVKAFAKPQIEHQAGIALKLDCDAVFDENLTPKFVWSIDGRRLDELGKGPGHFRIGENNSLVVESPSQDDSGSYECTVSTKLDSASKRIRVLIEDVPTPINSALLRCEVNGLSAQIDFEHMEPEDRPKPVKEFWVRYTADPDVDSGKWTTYPVPIVVSHKNEFIDDHVRIVKGKASMPLRPFGTYVFQVIARNDIGDSAPFTLRETCITAQRPPDRNPSGVHVEGSQPDNLIVYWEPMPRDEWNAESFSYKILYRREGEGGAWAEVRIDDPFATKHTIDLGDRHAWEPYEVQVKAVNAQGPSQVEPMVVVGRTGEGDPGVSPTNFHVRNITATTADFYWDPVDPRKVQGNFTGYKITYWHDDNGGGSLEAAENGDNGPTVKEARFRRLRRSGGNPRRALVSSGGFQRKTVAIPRHASMVTITDLKPNTMNYAVISVTNGQNDGSPSQQISFRTNEGVPTSVRNLRAYAMNNKSPKEKAVVFLKWNPPRSANGRLTHYSIVKCLSPSEEEVHSCDADEGVRIPIWQTELRVTGLEHNTNYQFRVFAYTRAGQGIPNSADARTLPEALRLDLVPSRPSLGKEAIADDHFNVSFVPGQFDAAAVGPVGNTFYIKYKEADEKGWQVKHPYNDSSLRVMVDGLTPGTKYDVVAVSVQKDENDRTLRESDSRVHHISTSGVSPRKAKLFWIFVVFVVVLVLLVLLCAICLLIRHRGQKYPCAEKERQQGREPILSKDRAFQEYRTDDDEKRSLTRYSHGGQSESADSMGEFENVEHQGFDEEGSFVHQYGPGKTALTVTNSSQKPPS